MKDKHDTRIKFQTVQVIAKVIFNNNFPSFFPLALRRDCAFFYTVVVVLVASNKIEGKINFCKCEIVVSVCVDFFFGRSYEFECAIAWHCVQVWENEREREGNRKADTQRKTGREEMKRERKRMRRIETMAID